MPKRTLAKRVLGVLVAGGLDDPLGHRLRGAHHRLRVDRLVGGDQDEALDVGGGGGLGGDPGRDRVVAHSLERIGLHQRHVLVGGGVEDDARLEALHRLQHPVRLLAVGEHRLDVAEVALVDHLALDLEEVVLGVVEHHQQARPDAGDLAAELGADRAAGAGDEDDAVAQVGADAVELDHDRVAAEHVLDLDLAQLLAQLDAAAQELEHGRQGANADLALPAGGDDPGSQRPRRRGDRDHDLVGLGLVEDRLDLRRRPQHLEAEHPHPLLARVVVDEADRGRAQVRVEVHLADDHLTAGAGADDQHLVLGQAVAVGRPLDDQPHREAGAGDQEQGEHEVHHRDRARQADLEGLQRR